jgi:hypothetical protein
VTGALSTNLRNNSIYGNNEITCGNSYSTLWHVTAWADSNTKIAGDLNYDLCSSLSNCLGTATPLWDLSAAQPFAGTPPPPGYGSIFSNPIQSQYINQPSPITADQWEGLTSLNQIEDSGRIRRTAEGEPDPGPLVVIVVVACYVNYAAGT